jgi:hypothetical protein
MQKSTYARKALEMRFQLKQHEDHLMLWVYDGTWHRTGPHGTLLYSSQRHALLDSQGNEAMYYDPPTQTWLYQNEEIRARQVSRLRISSGTPPQGDGKLGLWIRKPSHWHPIYRGDALEYDCAAQTLLDSSKAPVLFYSQSANAWSVTPPKSAEWSVKELRFSDKPMSSSNRR